MSDLSPAAGRARCAAVDMGSSTGRVMVAELDGGRITLEEMHRFESPLGTDPATGYDCWDMDTIVAEVRAGLEKAEAAAPLDSVGCDTWGVDFVLLDERLERVGLAVAYRDDRTKGRMARVFARMAPEEIYRRTGIHFQPYNTLYQLRATADEQPDWLARARHLLFTPDYLHFALSGVITNEYTIASTSQMLSLATRDWDPELLAAAGLDRPLMVKPIEPGTVIGETRLETSGRTIKVIAPGGHDTASAVAVAPVAGPDEAYISSGTWSLMGIESGVPHADETAHRFNFGNEGGVCGRYTVLKNLMGLWLIQRVRKEMGEPPFDELVERATASPPWRTLVDPDDARFLNPASMVDTIRTVAAEHGEPVPADLGALARTVFDSLALDYARVKGELEVLRGRPVERIRIIGGGSRNGLLNQLTADACGVPVSAGPVETAALGNACLQMMALGRIASLEDARAIVRRSFDVSETAPASAVPETVRRRYRRVAAVS